jgi:hypothetical protein
MRKANAEASSGTIPFNTVSLQQLQAQGYHFVQVKGFTIDKHYDYIDPHTLVLLPLRSLPSDPDKKDIYEPIPSELLMKWASELNEYPEIVISNSIS